MCNRLVNMDVDMNGGRRGHRSWNKHLLAWPCCRSRLLLRCGLPCFFGEVTGELAEGEGHERYGQARQGKGELRNGFKQE